MKDLKKHAAIILTLFVATTIFADTITLKGWATTTGSGTLTQGNWGMFATFGQPAAGIATQGNYTLYMGVIRPYTAPRYSISGYVNYYRGSFPAVQNAEMCLSNGGIDTVLTDIAGYYNFASILGNLNYQVKPRKINAGNSSAVSSFDAALVLRHTVGMVVLDALDNGLVEHARQVGEHIKSQLTGMMQRHSLIADVRGLGLLVGIELRKNNAAAVAERNAALQRAFERGVLLIGSGESLLRMTPPLILTREEADIGLQILNDVLKEA